MLTVTLKNVINICYKNENLNSSYFGRKIEYCFVTLLVMILGASLCPSWKPNMRGPYFSMFSSHSRTPPRSEKNTDPRPAPSSSVKPQNKSVYQPLRKITDLWLPSREGNSVRTSLYWGKLYIVERLPSDVTQQYMYLHSTYNNCIFHLRILKCGLWIQYAVDKITNPFP